MDPERRPPVLDMTPDGHFAPSPARPRGATVLSPSGSLMLLGLGAMAAAALTFWLALFLIPVALVVGLVGWGVLRFQVGRAVRRF